MTKEEAQPEILKLVQDHSTWNLRSAEIQALVTLAFSYGDETVVAAFTKVINRIKEKHPHEHDGIIINAEYLFFGTFLKALAAESVAIYGLFTPDEKPYSVEDALVDSDGNNPAVAA